MFELGHGKVVGGVEIKGEKQKAWKGKGGGGVELRFLVGVFVYKS